ncbi:hypothetical protein ACFWA9_25915 [Kitasatospora sp. NPDC059973]|uniref:hypothetical protein n=1 Tax=Kitasatospora sp. NPDC059973 TaxID=3347020 RepID=UPI0036896A0B
MTTPAPATGRARGVVRRLTAPAPARIRAGAARRLPAVAERPDLADLADLADQHNSFDRRGSAP